MNDVRQVLGQVLVGLGLAWGLSLWADFVAGEKEQPVVKMERSGSEAGAVRLSK